MTPAEVVELHEGLVHYHADRYAHLIPTWEKEDLEQEARTALWRFALERPGDDLRGGGATRAITFRLGKLRHRYLKHGAALLVRDPFKLGALTTDVELDALRVSNLTSRDHYPSEQLNFDEILGVDLSDEERRICAGLARGDMMIEIYRDLGLTRRMGERRMRHLRNRIEEARDETR